MIISNSHLALFGKNEILKKKLQLPQFSVGLVKNKMQNNPTSKACIENSATVNIDEPNASKTPQNHLQEVLVLDIDAARVVDVPVLELISKTLDLDAGDDKLVQGHFSRLRVALGD